MRLAGVVIGVLGVVSDGIIGGGALAVAGWPLPLPFGAPSFGAGGPVGGTVSVAVGTVKSWTACAEDVAFAALGMPPRGSV